MLSTDKYGAGQNMRCPLVKIQICTIWRGNWWEIFCSMVSESSPCLLGQNGSCRTDQQPVELSNNILQKLFICKLSNQAMFLICTIILRHEI